ncbi:MAG: flagellar M-ring protein FliF, partial [Candidatus Cloacimonetes bacterium]|nr:flagellar M-ring protein FliF [Candidatus Cloacimonadota bacterium]
MKDNLRHVWEKIKEVYARMEMRQRVMIAILLAMTFGLMIWMISWTTMKPKAGYALLFARLSSEDAQEAINSLNDQKIPFRLKEEGRTTTIYVPEDVVHITRIGLTAGEFGMKSQAGVGFEIFDRTSLGQTEKIQGINWVRANQGELERTIMAINGVDFARVHLVTPERPIFIQDQREPSASVMLRLAVRLSKKQIDGIVNLIASAVEGLAPEEITIIDQDGKILNEPVEDIPLNITDM